MGAVSPRRCLLVRLAVTARWRSRTTAENEPFWGNGSGPGHFADGDFAQRHASP